MERAMCFDKVVVFPVNGRLHDKVFSGIQNDAAIIRLKNANLTEKRGTE